MEILCLRPGGIPCPRIHLLKVRIIVRIIARIPIRFPMPSPQPASPVGKRFRLAPAPSQPRYWRRGFWLTGPVSEVRGGGPWS